MVASHPRSRFTLGYPELRDSANTGDIQALSAQIQQLKDNAEDFEGLSDKIQKSAEEVDKFWKLKSEEKSEIAELKRAVVDIENKLPGVEAGPILVKSQHATTGLSNVLRATPKELTRVVDVMVRARDIISLTPNWDGEGGIGCDEATWLRAYHIVVDHAVFMLRQFQKVICPYRVMPDLEGGLDIHWRSGELELLLNVPCDSDETVTFFGNNQSKATKCKTSGELGVGESVSVGVVSWLAAME